MNNATFIVTIKGTNLLLFLETDDLGREYIINCLKNKEQFFDLAFLSMEKRETKHNEYFHVSRLRQIIIRPIED